MSRFEDAIEKIVEIAKPTPGVITVGGVEYATGQVVDLRKGGPQPAPIELATLTGFVDYVKTFFGADKGERTISPAVHVVSPVQVSLVSNLYGAFHQRDTFLVTRCYRNSFKFGEFYDNESFIISLQSTFVSTPSRAQVLAVVGNIREESVKTSSDDGVTQTVAARAGIATLQEVAVPNPVSLRPWRTFREIEQPESAFVLRLKQGTNGNKPTCALFEADGSSWGLEAILRIRAYLTKALGETGIPIIA